MQKIKLKRELGLWATTLCGVGIILGAGIYALIGKAAGLAGNGVWISFIIAAFVAALSGLSYAELSSIFPKAGAEYVYTKNAFGRRIAFIVGWLIIISGVVASSAVAIGFAGYFNALTGWPILLSAGALVLFITLVMLYGIGESAKLAIIGTIVEAGGLILIVAIALPYFGSVDYFEIPSVDGVLAAASLIFFAFIGFEEMTRLSEEVKEPKKNMPRALILAIFFTTIIYILVAISAVSILDWQALGASSAPLADVAKAVMGTEAFFAMAIIALFATGNTVLLILMATSRIVYGMANAQALPSFLAWVHPSRRSPWGAIIPVAIVTVLFFFLGGIELIASVTNYTVFITFIVINAALIKLRFDQPDLKRPFRTPVNIGKLPVLAVLAILTSAFMLLNVGWEAILYGTILLLTGFVVYEFKPKPKLKSELKKRSSKKK
ncbi:amino acid permease [Candidatus Micrarchaeota archaeon]|nr:amino acid permease [Candidatus Micrarchaeota archaeon]